MSRDVDDLFSDVSDQGWNDETMLIHLTGFINKKGLFREFREYIREIAEEENSCQILDL